MDEVRIQTGDFDVGAEIEAVTGGDAGAGAVACFVGLVRDVNDARPVGVLTLEHYPGMTEDEIARIVEQARRRWSVRRVRVVHRVGRLEPTDRIVLVVVAGAHRGDAFAACEFIMDYLKTRAPFWKKETGPEGESWVDARSSDKSAAARWEQADSRAESEER